MKRASLFPLGLALTACVTTAHAGLPPGLATTTHVVAVGQAFLEKAIRVRENGSANADVKMVAEAFRERGAQVHTLAEEQLTRDALKALLSTVAKAMKPQDSLVFYFGGFSGQASDRPVLFVQGVSDKPDALRDSSRQIALAELHDWLGATGAGSLLMLLDTGPDAPRFCGPWAKPAHLQSLTSVCADLPAETPGAAGAFAQTLAAGLQGPADTNADHQYTGDELAGWMRDRLPGGATVFHTGPVKPVLQNVLDKIAADSAKAIQQTADNLPAR